MFHTPLNLFSSSSISSIPARTSVSSEMGRRDRSSLRSDSGYGDELPELAPRCSTDHPLTLKGYEIGPASKLHIGDVFEFIWADAAEFQWEWKCLGYSRFIVLRHSESFPHHCVCIPISTGSVSKHDFAKPGIDSFQQGFVFANGDPNPGYEQPRGGPKLQYSAVGVELRPGRHRIKEDSRANYADIIQVDHDAQVLVVGDVVKYFDRVRRNVNKAYMRQILRMALEKYHADKVANSQQRPPSIVESVDGNQDGAECRQLTMEADRADTYTLNETDDEGEPTSPQSPQEEVVVQRESVEIHRSYSYSSRQLAPTEMSQASDPRQSKTSVRGSKPEADYDLRSMHKVAMAGLK